MKNSAFSGNRTVPLRAALVLMLAPAAVHAGPYDGLWVGRVVLNQVNEVSSAVDENNVRVQTSPEITTPTSDQAEIMVMLHVSTNGTVRLLKSVAIGEKTVSGVLQEELITDPALFGQYPVARRLAAAAFEFGDLQAADPINSLADKVSAEAAAKQVSATTDVYDPVLLAANTAVDEAESQTWSASLTAFVNGTSYQSSAVPAAQAAAEAAKAAYTQGLRSTALRNAVRSSVLIRLQTLSQMADGVTLNDLPGTGSMAPGNTVNFNIRLGAYHPANPFRHRRNPAHRGGYDLNRKIDFQISAPATAGTLFDTSDRGTDQLKGIYREEIMGLHKPLGPQSATGLITRGTFIINRISSDATLND